MKDLRATFDQRVVDAWAAQLATRARGIGRAQMLLLFALVASVAWILLAPNNLAVVLAFGIGAVLVALQLVDRHSLLCPHCQKSPISKLQRGTAAGADFCVHCFYWLKNPRGD